MNAIGGGGPVTAVAPAKSDSPRSTSKRPFTFSSKTKPSSSSKPSTATSSQKSSSKQQSRSSTTSATTSTSTNSLLSYASIAKQALSKSATSLNNNEPNFPTDLNQPNLSEPIPYKDITAMEDPSADKLLTAQRATLDEAAIKVQLATLNKLLELNHLPQLPTSLANASVPPTSQTLKDTLNAVQSLAHAITTSTPPAATSTAPGSRSASLVTPTTQLLSRKSSSISMTGSINSNGGSALTDMHSMKVSVERMKKEAQAREKVIVDVQARAVSAETATKEARERAKFYEKEVARLKSEVMSLTAALSAAGHSTAPVSVDATCPECEHKFEVKVPNGGNSAYHSLRAKRSHSRLSSQVPREAVSIIPKSVTATSQGTTAVPTTPSLQEEEAPAVASAVEIPPATTVPAVRLEDVETDPVILEAKIAAEAAELAHAHAKEVNTPAALAAANAATERALYASAMAAVAVYNKEKTKAAIFIQ